MDPDTGKNRISNRGFASMSPERPSEFARKGGSSVPNEKRSFSTDSDLAREPGRKGGCVSHMRREGNA